MSENATVLRAASCSLELEATWCEARPRDRQGRRNFVFYLYLKEFGWIWLDANIQKKIENATVLRGASGSNLL